MISVHCQNEYLNRRRKEVISALASEMSLALIYEKQRERSRLEWRSNYIRGCRMWTLLSSLLSTTSGDQMRVEANNWEKT
jgi:hypothetical protein